MRFLHSKSAVPALAIAIGLGLNCARIFAASTSTEVVVEANDVDLAKLQTGAKMFSSVPDSGSRSVTRSTTIVERSSSFQTATPANNDREADRK